MLCASRIPHLLPSLLPLTPRNRVGPSIHRQVALTAHSILSMVTISFFLTSSVFCFYRPFDIATCTRRVRVSTRRIDFALPSIVLATGSSGHGIHFCERNRHEDIKIWLMYPRIPHRHRCNEGISLHSTCYAKPLLFASRVSRSSDPIQSSLM